MDKNINASQIYLDYSVRAQYFINLLPESLNKLECLENLGNCSILRLIPLFPRQWGCWVNQWIKLGKSVIRSGVLRSPGSCPLPCYWANSPCHHLLLSSQQSATCPITCEYSGVTIPICLLPFIYHTQSRASMSTSVLLVGILSLS